MCLCLQVLRLRRHCRDLSSCSHRTAATAAMGVLPQHYTWQLYPNCTHQLQLCCSTMSFWQPQQSACWSLQQPFRHDVQMCCCVPEVQRQYSQQQRHCSRSGQSRLDGEVCTWWVHGIRLLLEGGKIKHRWLRKAYPAGSQVESKASAAWFRYH